MSNFSVTDYENDSIKSTTEGGFRQIVNKALEVSSQYESNQVPVRLPFDIHTWNRARNGGLTNNDRVTLARIYGNATSVFEYGLGESTFIADHVGVPRYAGVDSDPVYVADTREKVYNSHFRFYFADVGATKEWGVPEKPLLPKNVLNYQLVPLMAEMQPFDVYMVDGRWRQACLLASFLHASERGAPHNQTIVLMHDCERLQYHSADALFHHIRNPNGKLCVYRRQPSTTDAQIVRMWMANHKRQD